MASHELLGGLVQVYRRGKGRYWQCSASVKGKQYRATTGEQDLEPAKQAAEEWYLGLRGKAIAGLLKTEKTFGYAADQFEKEYELITDGQRSKRWTEGHKSRLKKSPTPVLWRTGIIRDNTRQSSGIPDAPCQELRHGQTTVAQYASR